MQCAVYTDAEPTFWGAQKSKWKGSLFEFSQFHVFGICTIVLYKLLNCVTVKNIWKSTKNRPILMNKSLTETEWCHWLVKIRAKCSAKQKRKWAKLSAKLWGIKQKFSKTLGNQAKVQQNSEESSKSSAKLLWGEMSKLVDLSLPQDRI